MDTFRLKLTGLLLAFGAFIGVGVGALLYYALPQLYPKWYLGIAFFFPLLEILLVGYADAKSRKASAKQMVSVYLLAKVVKMLASLLLVAVYALTVKTETVKFALIFVVFYALYLIVETCLFAKIEKRVKND
ncbi:MAG: hypothetical protein LBR34_02810 [Prevotella sp.]|jgi:L-asparagine transporter-like permease|nr:hypothetical protein [Prevotella sp.]